MSVYRALSLVVLSTILLTTACLGFADQPNGVGTSPSFHGPTGLQIYSLRNQLKEDPVAAFEFMQKCKFKEVEIGLDSYYGMTKEELRDALKKYNLKPIAAHAGQDFLTNKMDEAVELAKFFDIKYVGIAWASHEAPMDEQKMLGIAEEFNAIGAKLKEKGLQFFYHNHGFEFYPYKNGETLFDLLMQKTDPENVKFELDLLWAAYPGQDPVKLLEKYPNRWVLMHMKDMAKGVKGNLSGGADVNIDVALGSGQIDFPAVLKAAQKAGVKHYFIEDESDSVLKQIPQSLEYLQRIGF